MHACKKGAKFIAALIKGLFSDGHLQVTNCKTSHGRKDLSCKLAAEFNAFLESGKKYVQHIYSLLFDWRRRRRSHFLHGSSQGVLT